MTDITKIKEAPYPLVAEISTEVAREGFVLLKNERVLPLKKNETVSVFGRSQLNYYKSGTGSGGLVNTLKVNNIPQELETDPDININSELLSVYENWVLDHPFDEGKGWASEPWCQEEMPLSDEIVKKAAEKTETAIVIIGRLAGEDRDNCADEGSYLLTDLEDKMLAVVSRYFKKVCVLLNTGNVIDVKFAEKYNIGALLYIWQGGQTGAKAVCDILSGRYSPSGKLSDTCVFDIEDYPSNFDFGNKEKLYYKDDIYVGYRYFETFAKDKVLYPFGFGLSYTTFDIKTSPKAEGDKITISATVKNVGSYSGKEVVQVYYSAPQGKLGKPARELVAFEKTPLLAPGEEAAFDISFEISQMASYDDSGATGNKSCYVLEAGDYKIYVGTDVRSAKETFTYTTDTLQITAKLSEALAPVEEFERIKPLKTDDGFAVSYEKVPLRTVLPQQKRLENMPEEILYTGDKGIKLKDVYFGNNTLDEFIAQLSVNHLACLSRGEGMNCSKVTPGTGSGFGGLTKDLMAFGIPAVCTTDGPSGLRLDSGAKATSMPNGTLFACTFNDELIKELHKALAVELYVYDIDALLGPGLNIHRHPLNGRNFEYFSEDPFLTGIMTSKISEGLSIYKGTSTIKHFCCNNQETDRRTVNAVVSERALREIYLKGFEIAVNSGFVKAIMTSYNPVNGIWTAGNYDLNTSVLRNEWGYEGIVMTDWWADVNDEGEPQTQQNTKAMIIAQNDLYMCTKSAENNANGDNTVEAYESGLLKLSELQRNAKNILLFILKSTTFDKYIKAGCPELKETTYDQFEKAYVFENVVLDKEYEVSLNKGTYFIACTYKTSTPCISQHTIYGHLDGEDFYACPLNGTDKAKGSVHASALLKEDKHSSRLIFSSKSELEILKIEILKAY